MLKLSTTATKQAPQTIAKQNGFTLLEILVTVIVLAIGLLGIASLQNTSIKLSYDSYLRSQASLLAYDLMERVRANPVTVANSGNYEFDQDGIVANNADKCIGKNENCSQQEILDTDIASWAAQVNAIFPDAEFSLVSDNEDGDNYANYTLTINWVDRYENEDDKDADTGAVSAEQARSNFEFNFEI